MKYATRRKVVSHRQRRSVTEGAYVDEVIPRRQVYTAIRRPKQINVVLEVVLPAFVQRYATIGWIRIEFDH